MFPAYYIFNGISYVDVSCLLYIQWFTGNSTSSASTLDIFPDQGIEIIQGNCIDTVYSEENSKGFCDL